MTAYYYNGSPILAPLTIESNQPIFVNDTVSLKQIRTAMNAQRWELSFDVLTNDNAVELLLCAVEDQANTKTMVMPQLKEVTDKGTTNSDLLVATTLASATDTTVNISKTTGTGIAPKGSFIKFSNHSKIYLLLTEINLSTFTSGDVEIYPSLRQDVPATTQLETFDDVSITYRPSIDNLKGVTYSDGILASPGRINIIEAL